MITPEFCQTMARYNAWQNHQAKSALERLTEADLRRDRGAFFGSLMGTINHLLWGDMLWIARFDGGAVIKGTIADGTTLCSTLAKWSTERFRTDQRILKWADEIDQEALDASLSWHSGVLQATVEKPMALCVTHFFNHQTHHRGQIHAMLTASGATAPVSDLVFMPEAGPWLH